MDDAFSRGYPFELAYVWRLSSFELEQTTGSLIESKLLDPSQLEFQHQGRLNLPELDLPDIGDVVSLDGNANGLHSQPLSPTALPSLSKSSNEEGDTDIWSLNFDLDNAPQLRQIYTWETFGKKQDATATRTAYLSEAGPEAFNVALRRPQDAPVAVGVLPQTATLRALCNVVLGRSSNLFQWDQEKEIFISTLPDVSICGLSPSTSSSVITKMTAIGSIYRVLGSFASSPNRLSRLCTAAIAFKGCVIDILDGLEAKLLKHTQNCRSILQLQRTLHRPHQLVTLLLKLTKIVNICDSDEEIITRVSEFVNEHLAAGNCFAAMLKLILSRTSGPWLERLCNDVGLGGEALTPNTDSILAPPAPDDHSGATFAYPAPGADTMPFLVNGDDQALIASIKESVRAVRQHLPYYQFGWHNISVDNGTSQEPNHFGQVGPAYEEFSLVATKMGECMAWAGEERQHDWIFSLDSRISEPLQTESNTSNDLRSALEGSLDDEIPPDRSEDFCDVIQLEPLKKLRPAMMAQKTLLNQILLRHVFDELGLLRHLHLQRQYHLLGNGDFVARLAQALFSADTQTAERRRGVIPNSRAMGLRLDTREGKHWTPASSELRLTLAGVLTETYHVEGASGRGLIKQELPGGLSFSIRELPDEEIDRVMDVDSIYALDFLRLQYTAPPCLDTIITPKALKAYDDIFKFLIRLLRVQHVAAKLRERLVFDAVSRKSRSSPGAIKHDPCVQFALEAHTALSVLFTHFVDVGIEAPWRTYISSLSKVGYILSTDTVGVNVPQVGLDELRVSHDVYLERIRSRLFLRRKAEKLHNAVDNVLISVLAGALAADTNDNGALNIAHFKTALAELCDALESAVERLGRTTAFTEIDKSDAEAMKILLMRLR